MGWRIVRAAASLPYGHARPVVAIRVMSTTIVIVAFVIGALVGAGVVFVWSRQRRSGAQSTLALTTLIHLLDRIQRPDELTTALLEELSDQLGCHSVALFVREDVELHMIASRGMSSACAERLCALLDADASLIMASQKRRTLKPTDEGEYALVPLTHNRHQGVVVVSPLSALNTDAAQRLVEVAGGYTLIKLEAMSLTEALKDAATQDTVTRLHNQRYFLELFELEYQRSLRYKRSLAVLLCGVSHLESAAVPASGTESDAVLRQIANALRHNLRHFDIVGRYDTATLAVLLPEANGEIAATVAGRLVKAARKETRTNDAVMNIGIATVADAGTNSIMMLDAALDALRRAGEHEGDHVYISLE